MTYQLSFRKRIILAFCVFGLLLSLIYWLLIDISIGVVEDTVFENRMKNEISDYLDRRKADPDTPLPYSKYIKSYIGRTDMPQAYREMTGKLTRGFYETDGPGAIKGPGDLHVAVAALPDNDSFLYLIFDVGTLKVNEKYESIAILILSVISLMVIGIGAVIGILISGAAIAPLTELTDQVAQSEPDKLPMDLSRRFADDEIGFLARTLERHMARIQAFIQREKAFTRDASHELRTPITVINGALELIHQLPVYGEKSLQGPIRRIHRAANGMALTINTFLWLAREADGHDRDETCHVADQTRQSLDQYRELFKNKPIETELIEQDTPVIRAPAPVFRIAADNLIRNAFQYTRKGNIRVTITPGGIEVFNATDFALPPGTNSGAASNERGNNGDGFGFGLDIVKRLCSRFNWHLEIKGEPGAGTKICLRCSDTDAV